MEVLALTPRGYCHGVVSAMNILKMAANDSSVKTPITVLGMLVHNQKIVDDLRIIDVHTVHDPNKTRLELLDDISSGTVVFTAHGVSDSVIEKALAKNLDIIDATCSDVKSSQSVIKSYLKDDYHVLFIGKHQHPESETALSISNQVVLITSLEDVNQLDIHHPKLAITNQTTMSLFDVYHITEAIHKKYPLATLIEETCFATKARQLAVITQPKTVEHCFVVGDINSNNTNKLVELAKTQGIKSSRIDSVEDLDINLLKSLNYVSVTSGASTPSQLTQEVIQFLKRFDKLKPTTYHAKSSIKSKNIFR